MKNIIKYFLLFLCFINNIFANEKISLIRDTEIENFLYEISLPIFKSANLNPNDIHFYIINDNNINAFVMGGQNIFVNTGTIINFDTPDALLGIIAHETGHISGGHLARFNEQLGSMQNISIGSILLGIGALIAGVPELGQAIIYAGLQTQQQTILSYTREQEEMADELATKYLNENNLSASALLYSMNKFYIDELSYSNNMEYYSTHPLSRNRKQFIENKIKNEHYLNDNFNKKYQDKFNFIKYKILAYNNQIEIKNGNSDYQKYANSIIYMKNNNIKKALSEINDLIKKYKNNPYFYELKGDIFLKNNNIKEALINYNIADNIIQNNTLIKKMIAFIIIKYDQQDLYQTAINNLNYISQKDTNDNSIFRLLAEVYYKNNETAMLYLNLSKYYVNLKKYDKANDYLKLALKNTSDKKIINQIDDLRLSINKE